MTGDAPAPRLSPPEGAADASDEACALFSASLRGAFGGARAGVPCAETAPPAIAAAMARLAPDPAPDPAR